MDTLHDSRMGRYEIKSSENWQEPYIDYVSDEDEVILFFNRLKKNKQEQNYCFGFIVKNI